MRYTLLTDGSSDRALIPLINWTLRTCNPTIAIQPSWVDLYRVNPRPKRLTERILLSVQLYPCDLLFIHRDAEGQSSALRKDEIRQAVDEVRESYTDFPEYVCVVPVRMQEAWLLFDEYAIRQAAGNPNGNASLPMPKIRKIEGESDPKKVLYELLAIASELTGRRLKRLDTSKKAYRVSELIESFEPLRVVPAFSAFEQDVQEVVNRLVSKT